MHVELIKETEINTFILQKQTNKKTGLKLQRVGLQSEFLQLKNFFF